jgi:hypothetical protein
MAGDVDEDLADDDEPRSRVQGAIDRAVTDAGYSSTLAQLWARPVDRPVVLDRGDD